MMDLKWEVMGEDVPSSEPMTPRKYIIERGGVGFPLAYRITDRDSQANSALNLLKRRIVRLSFEALRALCYSSRISKSRRPFLPQSVSRRSAPLFMSAALFSLLKKD